MNGPVQYRGLPAAPLGDLDLWDEGVSPHTQVVEHIHVERDTGPMPALTDEVIRAHLCPGCTGLGANLPICHACDRWSGGAP